MRTPDPIAIFSRIVERLSDVFFERIEERFRMCFAAEADDQPDAA